MEILDYTECIRDSLLKNPATGRTPFFKPEKSCSFCDQSLEGVFGDGKLVYDPEEKSTENDVHYSVSVQQCPCGWWRIEWMETRNPHWQYATQDIVTRYQGILRHYSLDDLQAPMECLRRELAKRPGILDDLHYRQMEELVGSVLSDYFPNCEAKHCGQSHDGGIDLMMVLSDRPIAVQVKHRQRIDKGEAVSYIRDFLGAMVIKGIPDGIYVTTADRFSPSSKKAAFEVVEAGRVSSFELINRHDFFSMLDVTSAKV